jgi:uncharacterized protein (UPF0276 family)
VRERHDEEDLVSGTVRGVGLGLRWELFDELDAQGDGARVPVDFFEVSPENFMHRGGRYPATFRRVAEQYPIVTHGLTMSLGGHDPLGDSYLRDIAAFVREVGSPWHSDHLCFGSVSGRSLHELLPVARTRASVGRIADRIRRAQDAVGVPLAIENVSYYWQPGAPEMGEVEFIAAVCDRADCGLMLDVNNAFVNAANFGFDVDAWMAAAPLERVVQIHVAGHEWFTVGEEGVGEAAPPAAGRHVPGSARAWSKPGEAMIIDTHGADVADPVLALLGRVLARTGPVPVLLERDQNIPSLEALLAELGRVRRIWELSAARTEDHAARAHIGE